MEQETMSKQILNALNDFGEKVDRRFNGMEMRFDEMENRFDKMENRFNEMENRLDRLEERVDGIEERMDKMEQRIDNLEKNMNLGFENLNKKLDRHIKIHEGTRAELAELQDTTDFLLKKVAAHEKKLRT